ncbi:MAG: Hsp70 family protein [Armatimonas sp.]
MHLAIDLGTTNSVAALAQEGSVRALSLTGLCREQPLIMPSLVPTAVFVRETSRRMWPRFWRMEQDALIGQAALYRNSDGLSPAFAQSFKRALHTQPHRPVAKAGGIDISAREAAYLFLREMLAAAKAEAGLKRIESLTITAPVGYYETYRAELQQLARRLGVKTLRTLDEPIAAALGYGVNVAREETLLIVDFGGGTLNLAAMRLGPRAYEDGSAPILAKHMVGIGGDDVDKWLLEELLYDFSDLPEWQWDAHWAVMQAKEAASRTGSATLRWRGLEKNVTRDALVQILTKNGLYAVVRDGLAEIAAQLSDCSPDEAKIDEVLLTGGSTLLPEIPATVDAFFPGAIVRHDPSFVFTAVASGAARFAGGVPVEDFVYHDYALAVQAADQSVEYELLVPRRTRYPTASDFAVRYYADYAGMEEMRFRVCEVGRLGQKAAQWLERPSGARYWQPTEAKEKATVMELNPGDAPIPLQPIGVGTSPRLRVTYRVDDNRWLRMTVEDLVKKATLRTDEPVVRLR